MLADLVKRLGNQEISLDIPDDVRDFLSEEGYSQVYGARPLRRVIQKKIEDPIAEEILTGMYREGDAIKLSLEDKKLVFERIKGGNKQASEDSKNQEDNKDQDQQPLES